MLKILDHELFMWIVGNTIMHLYMLKNDTLIKISVLNLLHYQHFELGSLEIKFYPWKSFYIHFNISQTFMFDRNGRIDRIA